MFCSKCGTDMPDDSRFCCSCGQTLVVVSTGGGAAAAAVPARIPASEAPPVSAKWWALPIIVLAVLGVVWLIAASIAHAPRDLANEVDSVHAHSWHAVTIQVPYDGSLTISAQVMRGNPMMMYLCDEDGFRGLQTGSQNAYWNDFYSQKAGTFQHTGRVSQGTYYFVLRDYSLGILSSSSSDVSVKAHLER